MILPVVIFHLHMATASLPMADPLLTGKEAQRFFMDEDALQAVQEQWQGNWFQPWNGESRGKYVEE